MSPLEDPDKESLLRVNVVGASGSGKSSLARELARRLGTSAIEMDQLFWEPDWKMPDDKDFFSRLEKALSCERWVLDGNYDRSAFIKWKSVTTVVWIDYSRARTIWQLLGRTLRRAITRRELWPGTGNRESFIRSFFTRESILLWSWRTHGPLRERYEARMKDPRFARIRFVRLRSPQETRRFLEGL